MSFRTKAIGISFIVVTLLLAVVVDLMNWSTWVVAIPAIGLEIGFFISVAADVK